VATSSGLRDVAIVGVGATPYYKRGGSLPKSVTELAGDVIRGTAPIVAGSAEGTRRGTREQPKR